MSNINEPLFQSDEEYEKSLRIYHHYLADFLNLPTVASARASGWNALQVEMLSWDIENTQRFLEKEHAYQVEYEEYEANVIHFYIHTPTGERINRIIYALCMASVVETVLKGVLNALGYRI